MLLDNATNYPNVSRTISGIGNIVFDTDVVLLCDTSLGIVELTLLEIPLNHFSTQYKLYVVDNSNNASINPIKIIAPIGFLIDDQPFIFNSINNSSIIVRISSDFNYNSSNYGTLAVEDEGILIASDVRLIDFTGTGVTATASGTSVTVAVSGGTIAVSDESILLTPNVSSFNFLGTGITATNVGTAVTVTVPQNLIQTLDEGINLTTNTQSLNFVGGGITATSVGNAVTVTVPTASVPIATYDEGILKTATTQSFNFVGAGITATNVGNAVTITSFAVAIETYDEGILKTATTQSFNFVGGGITATNVGNAVTVTVPTASVPIETYDEGILKTATTQSFNFVGAGVVATNVGNAVTVTISGGGSAIQTLDEGVSLTLTTASYNIVGANIRATNVVNAVTITADPFIVSHTYATLLTAISTNSLIAGQTVFITDAIYTTFFNNILIQVSLEALSTNTISVKGSGTFFNADYQTVGNYSGVAGYTGQTGVYNASTSYTIGKVCIYNNLHYKAIAVSLNNLPTNPAFWVLLAFTGVPALTNGYIREIDIINYNIQDNTIIYREDIRKNRVYQDKTPSLNKVFALFQFGKNIVNNNNVVNCSFVDIVNSAGSFFYNDLDCSELTGLTVNSNENTGSITKNNFKNTTITFRNLGSASAIQQNNFFSSTLTINNQNSGTIFFNDFASNGAIQLGNRGKFNSNKVYRCIGSNFINVNPTFNCELNLFDGCNITYLDTNDLVSNIFINSTFSITNLLVAPAFFTNNQIINCQSFNLVNSGNFNNNIIDNTTVNLSLLIGCYFNGNQFKDSNLNLSWAFSGTYSFLENIITNNSQILFFQDFIGGFSGNNFNESIIEYQLDYNGNFANNVLMLSTLTYYAFSSQNVINNIITKTDFYFMAVQNTNIFSNDIIDCAITIQNDSLNMTNNNWNNVQFNPYSHATIVVQSTIINGAQYSYDVNFLFINTIGGICADGINTITRELDFSDPNIKVAGDLTIPNCFADFYGIFLIVNGTVPAVDRIFSLSVRYNTTFKFSNSGSYVQFFQSLALPSIADGIASNLGNYTYKLKNITTVYTDEIVFTRPPLTKLNIVVNYIEVA